VFDCARRGSGELFEYLLAIQYPYECLDDEIDRIEREWHRAPYVNDQNDAVIGGFIFDFVVPAIIKQN
jgi:hypothetical protein